MKPTSEPLTSTPSDRLSANALVKPGANPFSEFVNSHAIGLTLIEIAERSLAELFAHTSTPEGMGVGAWNERAIHIKTRSVSIAFFDMIPTSCSWHWPPCDWRCAPRVIFFLARSRARKYWFHFVVASVTQPVKKKLLVGRFVYPHFRHSVCEGSIHAGLDFS